MRRLNKGAEIRRAMTAAGLDIPRLAEATRRVDPDGKGLSKASIGFLTSQGKSARETCSDRAARLLAMALKVPCANLFDVDIEPEPPSSAVAQSTSTPRVQILMSDSLPLPAQLMTSKQLCTFLQKSSSWLEKEIAADSDFPVHYVGRSRRFIPAEVLAHQAKRRAARLAAAS